MWHVHVRTYNYNSVTCSARSLYLLTHSQNTTGCNTFHTVMLTQSRYIHQVMIYIPGLNKPRWVYDATYIPHRLHPTYKMFPLPYSSIYYAYDEGTAGKPISRYTCEKSMFVSTNVETSHKKKAKKFQVQESWFQMRMQRNIRTRHYLQ